MLTKKQKTKLEKLAKDVTASKIVKGIEVNKMSSDQVETAISNLTEEEENYYTSLVIGENN